MEDIRVATGSYALRYAVRRGVVTAPRAVDAKQFKDRLTATVTDRSVVNQVNRVVDRLAQRPAAVEYIGTPALPAVRIAFAGSGDGEADTAIAVPRVEVDCNGQLIIVARNEQATDAVVSRLPPGVGATVRERSVVIALPTINPEQANDLVTAVRELATSGAGRRG